MMFKNARFRNAWLLIFSLFVIGFSIKEIFNPVANTSISLFNYVPVVFGIPMLVISILCLGFEIAYLILKKENNPVLKKIRNIVYIVIASIFTIYFIEYIILGTIQTFVTASTYKKIPEKDMFLVSTAWLLLNNYEDFLEGIGVTLSISLLGTIFGLVLALVLALLRIMKVSDKDSEFKAFFKKIGIGFSKGYIGLFRGTPMMVQAILLYYLVPFAISQAMDIPMDTMNKIFTWFVSGLITVTLNTTAYLAEVLRGGIESLDKGQMEAARSLGMTYPQAMIHVILPQALKNSMPSIGNEFVINIKDTSVLNVISVVDLFFVASRIQGQTFRFNEPFFIAACIYLILTFTTTKILSVIDKKMDIEEKPLPSAN